MGELWKEGAQWLKKLGVLPSRTNLFAPTARVYDLALVLQVRCVLLASPVGRRRHLPYYRFVGVLITFRVFVALIHARV